jgi:hypothetical protein
MALQGEVEVAGIGLLPTGNDGGLWATSQGQLKKET